MRAVSTLPDVVLFLVLVSGAVGTLALVPTPAPGDGAADETARTLTTTTAPVGHGTERAVHGTPAGVLATAALDGATVDGRRLLPPSAAVGPDEGVPAGTNVHVSARWRPYPNASLAGSIAVGPSPPRSATVDAAVVRVPTGLPGERAALLAARTGGFDGLARLLARALVERAFPPGPTRTALYDPRTRGDVLGRYRHAARAVGAPHVAEPLSSANATAANRRLIDALASRVGGDLRREFDTPRAAAGAFDVGTVELTVRTWANDGGAGRTAPRRGGERGR